MLFNISLTLFFVLLNGFFVAAEFAIVKVRLSQLELRMRTGSKLAAYSKNIVTHLDSYLSATQLGITLASLGLGWIGESVVSEIIIDFMMFFNVEVNPELAHKIALPLAFATITFLHIVFGELAPKSLAIQRSEQVTMAVSIPLRIFYLIFKPFIWSLNSFANAMVRMVGLESITDEQDLHSEEELRYLIGESTKSGIIDHSHHKLLENVFEFADTPVKQIMVPRNKIVAVPVNLDGDKLIDKFIEEGYSRMPVFDKSPDNIVGEIYAKDVISMMCHRNLIIMQDIIRPTYFINEDEKINKLLRILQRNRIHMAVVLDEFGGTAGIVTLEDIIEEIVGEIQDEYDEELPIIEQVGDNIYRVQATASIEDAADFLPAPLPDSEDYETIGGMINSHLGRIPDVGEVFEFAGYSIKIIKRAKSNIETVEMTFLDSIESLSDY